MLNIIIIKIASAPHLSASEETRVFLDPLIHNFLEVKEEKFEKNFNKLYDFYSKYFGFLQNCEITDENKKSIEKFLISLKRSRETLENFLLITTDAQNNKLEVDIEIQNLYENHYELDNNYIYEIHKVDKDKRIEFNKEMVECGLIENMYRTKFLDFFSCFYEWANVELIETEAMMEAILSINRIKEQYEMKYIAFKTEESYLNKLTNPNWFKKILFSTDYELIKQQTVKVDVLRKEKNSFANLLDIVYKILYYLEIPMFKNERSEFYSRFLNMLFTCNCQSKEKMDNIYNHLINHSLNILRLYNENRVVTK